MTFHNAVPRRSRPRASVACQECCRRKVRCDIEESMIPCTNCKLDEIQCTVCSRVRRKRAGERERRIHKIICKSDKTVCSEPKSFCGNSLSSHVHNKLHEATLVYSSPVPRIEWDLPSYFIGPPDHLDHADLAYLKAKGALSLPSKELQAALLESYVRYMHGFLPIVDLHHLLGVLLPDTEHRQSTGLSLFVYQAVMFASVGSVPLSFLAKAGFHSRTEIRAVFASKVKALYNVNFETNPNCLVQGLLMMACWQDFSGAPKRFSYWADIAWSIMQGMVLNGLRDLESNQESQLLYRPYNGTHAQIPPPLFRRMYWFCFLISRIIALSSHDLANLVRPDITHLGPLRLSDFDIAPFPEPILCGLGLDSKITSIERQRANAQLHIAVVELCLNLGDAVNKPNPLPPLQQQGTEEDLYTRLDRQVGELFQWYNSAESLISANPSLSSMDQKDAILRQSVPLILFHAALASLLTRQAILCETTPLGEFSLEVEKSIHDRRVVAASTVTAAFIRLQTYGLLHCLPPCIMALLLPATITHFTRVVSEKDPVSKYMNNQYLSQSLDPLREMAQITLCARRWNEVLMDLLRKHKRAGAV